jgi:molybdopterin-guanine dinucleotide biosynthesis protein
MAKGSPLRQAVAALVNEVLDEMKQTDIDSGPISGTVSAVYSDGTVDVQGSDGTTLTSIGAAVSMTVGQQVTVISADGAQVAVPH